MRYIEATVYTSEQGIEYVTAFLMKRGIDMTQLQDPREFERAAENEKTCAGTVPSDISCDSDQEAEVIFYLEDNEDNRRRLTAMKTDMMMLKSDELYMELGSGVDLGRLYVEDRTVEDADWKDS